MALGFGGLGVVDLHENNIIGNGDASEEEWRKTTTIPLHLFSGKIITPNPEIFTLKELRSVSRNFRPDAMVGKGGFGRVFKGCVDKKTYASTKVGSDDDIAVAIKIIIDQDLQEWQILEGLQGLSIDDVGETVDGRERANGKSVCSLYT